MNGLNNAIELSNFMRETNEDVSNILVGPISNRSLREIVKMYQEITSMLTRRIMVMEVREGNNNDVINSLAKVI